MLTLRMHLFLHSCLLTILCTGCGSGSVPDQAGAAAEVNVPVGTAPGNPPADSGPTPVTAVSSQKPAKAGITASLSGPGGGAEQPSDVPADGQAVGESGTTGTPEDEAAGILREIQQMRVAAVPADLEQARKTRRERNERIVELATNVLRLTMNDQAREAQFHQAIGQLLEARFQMALAGTQDDVDQLYADVQALNDRDPKSIAAAEGVYYIARFAHTRAGMLARSQPEWLTTLSQWAREFSDRFPEQQKRAVTLLFGAAHSCELHAATSADAELSRRLMTEAKLCYSALAEKFAETTQGQEAAAVLRRMALPGQPLSQFSGPTLDGGFVSVEDFTGKPTLIYFWASDDAEFVEELQPLLQKIRSQVPAERLRMVGVVLDEEETELEAFLERQPVPGQQIFFPNAEQRSWNSPLVRFWGISRSPSIWLVDARGMVVTTSAASADLVPQLQSLLK